MAQLSIEIPDDRARRLRGIATAENKSVEQVAIEHLRFLVTRAGSAAAVLRAINQPPYLSSCVTAELDAAIDSGRLPVREQDSFDRRSGR